MPASFPTEGLASRPAGLWRYREALPLAAATEPVSLGESMTPLTAVRVAGRQVLLKLDYLFPTGSFKDRGAAILLTKLRELGVTSAVEDSSGNAGAAMAAYAAAAGIEMRIFVPEGAPPAKLAQIRHYGARLTATPGDRQATSAAALAEAERSFYASHVWNPYFLEGVKTVAFEIWEQLGRRTPDWVVTPLGNGTLLLGLHKGFAHLVAAGVTTRLPRLMGVQAANCAPLALAWHTDRTALPTAAWRATLADGIAVARPARWRQIMAAVADAGGEIVIVSEEAIGRAYSDWARRGFAVEPTAASALAAWDAAATAGRLRDHETAVVMLTGSALKTPIIPDRT